MIEFSPKKTLYISDLDGTLLNPNGDLNPKTIDVINGLITDGLLFTYATARSFSSASKKTEKLKLNLPVIANNGTFIYEAKSGKPLFYRTLEKSGLAKIHQIVKSQNICVMVYALFDGTEKVTWVTGTETSGVFSYLNSRKGDMRFRPLKTYDGLFDGDVFYLTFIDNYENMSRLRDQFSDLPGYSVVMQEDVYTKGEYWLEILTDETSKGDGALKLKQMLGCDKIISFGDNLNDLSLFKVSDKCYATANAVDELKLLANGVTDSNENDGVALWLLENYRTKGTSYE